MATLRDDLDEDLEVLRFISPPEDYSQWLGWIHTLKALGMSAEEAEEWSATGTKYVAGEVLERWDGLQPEEKSEAAREKLRGVAYNLGWRRTANIKHTASRARSLPVQVSEGELYPWQIIGDHCVQFLRDKFRFDEERRAWWKWVDGNHWREAVDDTVLTDTLNQARFWLAAELNVIAGQEFAQKLADGRDWERHASAVRGEFWTRLRAGLARPMPSAPAVGIRSGQRSCGYPERFHCNPEPCNPRHNGRSEGRLPAIRPISAPRNALGSVEI